MHRICSPASSHRSVERKRVVRPSVQSLALRAVPAVPCAVYARCIFSLVNFSLFIFFFGSLRLSRRSRNNDGTKSHPRREMGKRGSKSKGGKGGGGAGEGWTGDIHHERESVKVASMQKRLARKRKMRGDDGGGGDDDVLLSYKRTAMSHDTADKIDAKKLRLHISRTKRQVDAMRERLRTWDDVEERRIRREEERKRREADAAAADEAAGIKKKKKGRAGPETWKLRGAARPAWEVYDFDTRYVDPHMKEHEEATARSARMKNLLSVYRGRFGEPAPEGGEDEASHPPQPLCRTFLILLMQLGHLNLEARRFKWAREAFLEAMDLEGMEADSVIVTTARCRLMRTYLEANRPDSARRLWERLPHDRSAWVRYSAALIEYVSWRVLEEEGSTRSSAEELLCRAIGASPYTAWNLAFHGTFRQALEYGDELEDEEPGSLLEAIEYCHSEQLGSWLGTEGATDWLQRVVLRLLNGGPRAAVGVPGVEGAAPEADLARKRLRSWEADLARIEADFQATEEEAEKEEEEEDQKEEEEEAPDLLMYTGMFRTAMDMLSDAGELLRVVEVSSDDEEDGDTS